ncbi:hypothetical protein M405DRAFT_867744 [Rhizopogon salebrosus TDB-379]|nr:hypothetical protein M405DRAFT_867744 [Rhizopogon salebrosus TDB-379]
MFMALIAAELIITWAARQYFSARKAAIEFNHTFGPQQGENSTATLLTEIPRLDDRNSPSLSAPKATGRKFKEWTVTHGFFAWMGGLLLYVNGELRATLTPDELLRFKIEARDIAILQLGWFVLQLVTRYIQNLPITSLEIDILAVAALTSTAYASPPIYLTYDKPDVELDTGYESSYVSKFAHPFRSLMGLYSLVSPSAVRSRRVPSLGGYIRRAI